MAFYIPEVVLALREMKKGNEGGGGEDSVNHQEERIQIWQRLHLHYEPYSLRF